jgi:deoxyribose-phosphate aldolase
MTRSDVARLMDYAILDPAAPETEYLRGCETTQAYCFAAFHVLPCRVAVVASELGTFARHHDIEIGAPIAFPYGSTPTEVKLAEAEHLIGLGATALDMVANVGWLKDGRYQVYQEECDRHIELCHAAGINGKVIIEVGCLIDTEIVTATRIVVQAGADFVKTGTGIGAPGYPNEWEVRLILDTLRDAGAATRLKVSGISPPRALSAYAFIRMGASRIGTRAAPEIVDALAEVQRDLYPPLTAPQDARAEPGP